MTTPVIIWGAGAVGRPSAPICIAPAIRLSLSMPRPIKWRGFANADCASKA